MRRHEEEVRLPSHGVTLEGNLVVPEEASGIVLFAHGSGSGRYSPRNRFVAGELNTAGIATLLLDLLTEEEEQEDLVTAALRFNIPLLATRLLGATEWANAYGPTRDLLLGYFGASTGAAAALIAAADRDDIAAIVSRGGRPDLAGEALPRVKAPTRLIVGGRDEYVLELNRMALEQLRTEKDLVIVPRATHLFEEPGALERVAELAAEWFGRHFEARAAEAA